MRNEINAAIRAALGPLVNEINLLKQQAAGPRSPTADVDAMSGRRIMFTFVQTGTFTSTDDGKRGSGLNFLVSQDGPFVLCYYPIAMWRSSLPTNATDFGKWRPVSSWPLPTQDDITGTDIINISYELADSGSQRNFQDNAVPGGLLSRPDNLIPLPAPTLFRENSTITFTPTYEDIELGGSTATTTGTLVVALPGYRIITGRAGNY